MYIINTLYNLVVSEKDNEEEILAILNDDCFKPNIKKIVNTIIDDVDREIYPKDVCYSHPGTSLLMWAVFNLKKNVVRRLLECGAKVSHKNENYDGVSSFWNLKSSMDEKTQERICEIAEMLHNAKVPLNVSGDLYDSLVDQAHQCKLVIVKEKVLQLGYETVNSSFIY